MTRFYVINLLLEEGNKCFEFLKIYDFVHEQQFALQDDWNEGAMYQKLCHVAVKHDKPVEVNAKSITIHIPQRTSKILLVRLTANENALF